MKRLSSSDSFGGLMSICPNATEEHDAMFSGEFPAMMDEDCGMEESGHVSEKKRRLSIDQVKALEKTFEVENKLEPERKVKLAQELGLQPRQVAVWFQNRRARWKTKQLERDYGALKANYDGLKLSFERLQHDKESLLKEIHELKSKIDGNSNSDGDAEGNTNLKIAESAEIENSSGGKDGGGGWPKFGDLKDGSSDSDSSAIVNDDMNSSSPREVVKGSPSSNSSMNVMSFQMGEGSSYEYQPQFVKIEEHNFFGEESCSTFFSDDQAPTLQWYCNDQWN